MNEGSEEVRVTHWTHLHHYFRHSDLMVIFTTMTPIFTRFKLNLFQAKGKPNIKRRQNWLTGNAQS